MTNRKFKVKTQVTLTFSQIPPQQFIMIEITTVLQNTKYYHIFNFNYVSYF